MRIITGIARGCRLETLPGRDTRPTTDRVKEAVFSAIQFELGGRQVLDLFAGSGQMGLEALSRGACRCVFVDYSTKAVRVIQSNIKSIKDSFPDFNDAKVVNRDVISYLKNAEECFDIAFIDPPYASNLLYSALCKVERIMNRGGVIVCESDADSLLPENVGRFALNKVYNFGRVRIRIYRYETEGENNESRSLSG